MSNWWIYRGTGEPHDGVDDLPDPPPWRTFKGDTSAPSPPEEISAADQNRAITYQPDEKTKDLVNAALYLRRPLLVTGLPGTGKSTLAYAVAHELGLGAVLRWPITSRVTLRDGLYQYDPVARLYAASRSDHDPGALRQEDIGRYVRLGPLGTALLPYERPRVLLIDEIDKSDLDLPNDLLTVFEEGEYEIPELVRAARSSDEDTEVMTAEGTSRVRVTGGRVRCRAFPFVVMTSNAEREFPPAFLRRCVQVELRQPNAAKLADIVAAHLSDLSDPSDDLIQTFLNLRSKGQLATDQLLNAIYLTDRAGVNEAADRRKLAERVMAHLSSVPRESDER